ncbi:MAG: diguanylate cyclase [Deltaproteobacteria bacterium]|jgi:two-component system cell cycle response regulator|nr:diguanylate cyclase [Deltaproteobacteria bacterium]
MTRLKKILIVDRELSYRELLRDALRNQYEVIDTGDYGEAASLAELTSPELIIMDVDASTQKGVELCELLKEDPETRDIPIILITSFNQREDIVLGLQSGASDYITKPLCLPEVVARVESHLRTQDYYGDLEHKDLLMLLELSEAISVTRNPNAILRLIVKKMSKIIDVERCSIISFSEDKKITVKASNDLEKNEEIKLDISRYPEIRKSIETKQTVIINDIKADPIMASVRTHIADLDYNSIVVIPLIKKQSVIGTFFLRTVSRKRHGINDRVYKLCQLAANIAANALENAILFETMKTAQEYFEEISIRDDLTKLYNRRYFYRRMQEELSRTSRYDVPLSLIFFDVDDFKRINDTYGHTQGDKVLMKIGKFLKETARESDIPVRFGGDEFAIILPNTTANGANDLANRISASIRHQQFQNLEGECITISMGISTYCRKAQVSLDDFVKLADEAMYKSKSQGRGLVSQL